MLPKKALDALKARQMAKLVGLEPEPGSQWRWALRHLRNRHTGKPLEGDELQAAKEKMGKLPPAVLQQIQAKTNRVGQDNEIAMTIHQGDHKWITTLGDENSVHPYIRSSKDGSLRHSVHTHPFNPRTFQNRFTQEIDQFAHDVKGPGAYAKPLVDDEDIQRFLADILTEWERMRRATPRLVSPSGLQGIFENKSLLNSTPPGDVGHFYTVAKDHPQALHSIVNPQLGLESTHKVRFPHLRSTYWSGNADAIQAAKLLEQPKMTPEWLRLKEEELKKIRNEKSERSHSL